MFYGGGPTNPEDIARIRCPVYGFYGGNDARVTSTVAASKELMEKAGKKYFPETYPGAGHGFMRGGEAPDASPADKAAHDKAWQRWKEELKKL